MRTLVYKRTHTGDPDAGGRFGIHGCMGRVRAWSFDAVIGVGGMGPEPTSYGIDGRVTWIGIGPHKTTAKDPRGPLVTFDHFVLFDERGPLLHEHAPRLARHMYEGRVRVLFNPSPEEAKEIAGLLRLARKAPPSSGGNAKLTGRTIPCRCGKKHSPSCPNHSTAIRNCKPGRRSARQLSPRLRSHDPC